MSGRPLSLLGKPPAAERFHQGFAGNIRAGQQNALPANIAQAGQNGFGDVLLRDEVRLDAAFSPTPAPSPGRWRPPGCRSNTSLPFPSALEPLPEGGYPVDAGERSPTGRRAGWQSPGRAAPDPLARRFRWSGRRSGQRPGWPASVNQRGGLGARAGNENALTGQIAHFSSSPAPWSSAWRARRFAQRCWALHRRRRPGSPRRPSTEATSPSISSERHPGVGISRHGAEQPPPSAARKARSAVTAPIRSRVVQWAAGAAAAHRPPPGIERPARPDPGPGA